MTLLAQARAVLQTVQGPFQLDLEEGMQRLECDFTALDSLACALSRFELSTAALAGKTPTELKRLGEQLSAQLTYLLEPINPIEFDAEQCVVQLRSNPPQRDEDRTSYYELVAKRGGSLSLCRYVKAPGSVRENVPMHLTREVFFRLVSDFAAAAI
jgi:hypothetical protein